MRLSSSFQYHSFFWLQWSTMPTEQGLPCQQANLLLLVRVQGTSIRQQRTPAHQHACTHRDRQKLKHKQAHSTPVHTHSHNMYVCELSTKRKGEDLRMSTHTPTCMSQHIQTNTHTHTPASPPAHTHTIRQKICTIKHTALTEEHSSSHDIYVN